MIGKKTIPFKDVFWHDSGVVIDDNSTLVQAINSVVACEEFLQRWISTDHVILQDLDYELIIS